jgi:hypothetical protein
VQRIDYPSVLFSSQMARIFNGNFIELFIFYLLKR